MFNLRQDNYTFLIIVLSGQRLDCLRGQKVPAFHYFFQIKQQTADRLRDSERWQVIRAISQIVNHDMV